MPRALTFGALAAVLFAAVAPAQQAVDSSPPARAALDGRIRTEIAIVSRLLGGTHVPAADSFRLGNTEVAAGSVLGSVAVARGTLSVRGRVEGDALVMHGDIIVHQGGHITGDAVAVDGRVRTAGGIVDGDVRSIRGIAGGILARAAGEAPSEEPVTTWGALKVVFGWFAVLCVIGIGVLLFAERNLDGVVAALEQRFTRAFWTGVLAQLAAIPALLLIIVGLAITVLGLLLIPFAVVAYVVALAGLVTLGFLAVARFTGRAFARGAAGTRRVNLRSLLIGLVVYIGLWLIAAAFAWNPVVGAVLRAVALAGSWVALTLGLGATIITRAGTQREGASRRKAAPVSDMSWQTPTPVTGVVAARRPVAAVKESR